MGVPMAIIRLLDQAEGHTHGSVSSCTTTRPQNDLTEAASSDHFFVGATKAGLYKLVPGHANRRFIVDLDFDQTGRLQESVHAAQDRLMGDNINLDGGLNPHTCAASVGRDQRRDPCCNNTGKHNQRDPSLPVPVTHSTDAGWSN
jgi:hypothetical protein